MQGGHKKSDRTHGFKERREYAKPTFDNRVWRLDLCSPRSVHSRFYDFWTDNNFTRRRDDKVDVTVICVIFWTTCSDEESCLRTMRTVAAAISEDVQSSIHSFLIHSFVVIQSFVRSLNAPPAAELTCECGPPSMNGRHLNSPGTHCTDLAVPDEIRL